VTPVNPRDLDALGRKMADSSRIGPNRTAGIEWTNLPGRDLDPVGAWPGEWARLVALLNVWNDVDELRRNLPSWFPHVDLVIVADGAYAGTRAGTAASDDGTLEYLRSLGPKVRIIEAPRDFWPDQCIKRTQLYRHPELAPGDLLYRVDADETAENAATLRETPALDVGWATYTSPVYLRPQSIPVVFRWRPGLEVRTRHHWTYLGDRLVSTHQQGGAGFDHRLIPLKFRNGRGANRKGDRQSTAMAYRRGQVAREHKAAPHVAIAGRDALRVYQVGSIDPGCAAYRLHSAINTTTPHSSVLVIRSPALEAPIQFLTTHPSAARALFDADVLHAHAGFHAAGEMAARARGPFPRMTVSHHHGTHFRRNPKAIAREDASKAALRLVSNLELLQYGPDLQFLPNAVPVARYARLAEERQAARRARRWKSGILIVAHSPTKPEIKGTDLFTAAVARLRKRKVPIESLVLQGAHADVLRRKAECDAVFDSFWLGLQVSGLEGAAMGLPVIAGDPDVRSAYKAWLGEVPYTWAGDATDLEEVLERLAVDPEFRAAEAARVQRYTEDYHDYGAVTARYFDLLDGKFKWRRK
jgi:hypothetical protein